MGEIPNKKYKIPKRKYKIPNSRVVFQEAKIPYLGIWKLSAE